MSVLNQTFKDFEVICVADNFNPRRDFRRIDGFNVAVKIRQIDCLAREIFSRRQNSFIVIVAQTFGQ